MFNISQSLFAYKHLKLIKIKLCKKKYLIQISILLKFWFTAMQCDFSYNILMKNQYTFFLTNLF